jgi:hypothetical protein
VVAVTHVLELIGPSGVGKTTLYRNLQPVIDSSWQGPAGSIFEAVKLNEYPDSPHFKLLSKKLESLESRAINSVQKTVLLRYFTGVVLVDYEMHCVPSPHTPPLIQASASKYLLDEGLLHNFAKELLDLEDKDFISLVNNKSVIYLRPKVADLVVSRILKRTKEGGHTVAHHQGLNYDELKQLTDATIKNLDSLIGRLKIHGCRVLVLRADSEIELLLPSVQDFLQAPLTRGDRGWFPWRAAEQ